MTNSQLLMLHSSSREIPGDPFWKDAGPQQHWISQSSMVDSVIPVPQPTFQVLFLSQFLQLFFSFIQTCACVQFYFDGVYRQPQLHPCILGLLPFQERTLWSSAGPGYLPLGCRGLRGASSALPPILCSPHHCFSPLHPILFYLFFLTHEKKLVHTTPVSQKILFPFCKVHGVFLQPTNWATRECDLISSFAFCRQQQRRVR